MVLIPSLLERKPRTFGGTFTLPGWLGAACGARWKRMEPGEIAVEGLGEGSRLGSGGLENVGGNVQVRATGSIGNHRAWAELGRIVDI